jgi:hypothetical protein
MHQLMHSTKNENICWRYFKLYNLVSSMLKALLKDVPFSTPSLVVAILSYKFDECGRSGLTFQFSE